jgi:tRNA-splicing ligase RtcB
MNRPDPYQARAREVCLATGVDPDSRVGEGRGMPAWCVYRDAARAEQVARETAEAAAQIAATIAPQPAEFQNSPLKIFGQHDEGTIAQMRNCMTVGNVVAGVICADGHLGYAQPVGGVIAYEKQISISGVGFDIGCGNMAIRLDTPYSAVQDRVDEIIRDVSRIISFGVGRTNEERVEHELRSSLTCHALSKCPLLEPRRAWQLPRLFSFGPLRYDRIGVPPAPLPAAVVRRGNGRGISSRRNAHRPQDRS